MPRIPYQKSDISEPRLIVDAIRRRRGGQLFHLDRMLLHSPMFAAGWNIFLGEIRAGLDLSPRLRSLAMCVVAQLNRVDFEFRRHAREFIEAGGNEEQVHALRSLPHPMLKPSLFDAAERAATALAIEMTLNVEVAEGTFSAVREALNNDQLVVELVGVIAAYNMVSRFLVALHIEPE